LKQDAGSVAWGHETHVGYFPQDHHEVLPNGNAKPLQVIWDTIPSEGTSTVRGHLGRMLFSGEDVNKPVSALSGGEAARLVFCRIMVQKPNVLVLDEPTNHLDLEAIDALVGSLKSFDGTVLFVSHDRAFVSEPATRILEVTEHGFRDFSGTYDEYLSRCGDDHLDAETAVLRAKRDKATSGAPAGAAAAATAAPTLSRDEQKRRSNRKKQLPAQRDDVLKNIEKAEQRKAAIAAMWCEPGFYERTAKADVGKLEQEERALGPQIDELVAKWEALEAEIAGLEAG